MNISQFSPDLEVLPMTFTRQLDLAKVNHNDILFVKVISFERCLSNTHTDDRLLHLCGPQCGVQKSCNAFRRGITFSVLVSSEASHACDAMHSILAGTDQRFGLSRLARTVILRGRSLTEGSRDAAVSSDGRSLIPCRKSSLSVWRLQ